MTSEQIRQDILNKIRRIADESGQAPGQIKFASATGIKDHVWKGKFWRGWSEALVEAGFPPNDWFAGYDEAYLLESISKLAKRLGHFPLKVDLQLEATRNTEFPSVTALNRRWNMRELAIAVAEYCNKNNEAKIAVLAEEYAAKQIPRRDGSIEDQAAAGPLGFVYMQQYGSEYKIGRTTSLSRRGRQIQIELPQEVVLVHTILTDDPAGVEAYWHKRFAVKRTRGEWFKLTKSDVVTFKRWSKIW